MKKSLLLLAAAATFGTAQAQKMGDVFIYGGISYSSEKTSFQGTKLDLNRSFSLTPGIGYQFDKNWGGGVQLEYSIYKTGATSASEQSSYQLATGLFARYTQPLSPMFFVFGQFNASYLRTSDPIANSNNDYEGNGFGLSVMPAIGINLSRSISVIGSFGSVGYQRIAYDASGSGANSDNVIVQNFGASIGDQFGLTVQWNLGERRMRTRREPMSETRNMDRYRDDSNEDREEAPRRRRGRMDNRRNMDRDDN
jgi:hypothetical protein